MPQQLVTADKPPRIIDVQPSKCRSCQAEVLWGLTANGKRCPYDSNGESHFRSCPDARTWGKPRQPTP